MDRVSGVWLKAYALVVVQQALKIVRMSMETMAVMAIAGDAARD